MNKKLESIIGISALALLLIGCFVVLRPFLTAVMWAVVLCFSSWPVYRWIEGVVRGRRWLAASLMTLLIALVMLIPFVAVGFGMADSFKDLASATRKWFEAWPPDPPEWLSQVPVVGETVVTEWEELASDSAQLIKRGQQLLEPASAWALSGGVMIGRGVIELALSIFIAFFLFRDGAMIARQFTLAMERIAGTRAQRLIEVAGETVRGVVYGILGTALAQGAVATIGFLIAGMPGALLLGFLVFCLSAVPVGPPLVWGTSAFWLFQQGWYGWALFMVIWGMGVSSLDNVVRPLLISHGVRLPFVLIFMGVVGGALAFGFIGVFLGPVLLAVGYGLIDEWIVLRKTEVEKTETESSAP